jgi:predicted dithiol-disulfide oxidoreductase (DUF899 family)
MALPNIVTRDEWLAARMALLEREKEMTRARDRLNAERRCLPMVRIEKDYVFDGPDGRKSLGDLFEGRSQLIVYHFMFAPEWEAGCKSCTAGIDEMSEGMLAHVRSRDTTYALVSRAPIDRIERYRKERGWSIPWYSSFGSDFNYDFQATIDPDRGADIYNYRTIEEHREAGTGYYFEGGKVTELPGTSVFLKVDEGVFHCYSSYGRGTEAVGGSYYLLDLTPLGRQEDWEEPKGRAKAVRAAVPVFDD